MKLLKILGVIVLVVALLCFGLLAFMHFSENGKILFPVTKTETFTDESITTFPSSLTTSSNKLVNEHGDIITLKGVSIVSPDKLHSRNLFKQSLFEDIHKLGANVVRIPVDPEAWESDEAYMWRYIDKAVSWSGNLGMYVIIDLHMIGNIDDANGEQMPNISQNPNIFAHDFWTRISKHYKDTPNVIFEVYNEPANIEADLWATKGKELIDTIRANAKDQLLIMSGVDYTKDLSWYVDHPIQDNNLAYACHIYPAHSPFLWDKWFGQLAKEHPVIVTEWGYIDDPTTTDQDFLIGNQLDYGEKLMAYLNDHNISWLAWAYDDRCEPEMLVDGYKKLTDFGDFVYQQLQP